MGKKIIFNMALFLFVSFLFVDRSSIKKPAVKSSTRNSNLLSSKQTSGQIPDQSQILPNLTTLSFSCSKLFEENSDISNRNSAREWKYSPMDKRKDVDIFAEVNGDCDLFIKNHKYLIDLPNTKEEEEFPIAFSILVFKSATQVERLLRTIYRPWNYYCFHVDIKSTPEFFEAINSLTKCLSSRFQNVVNTPNRVNIVWGKFSVLQADLNCMHELLRRFKKWKYLINLTGQEFPLKTNLELVRILKAFKGANNVDGYYGHPDEDRAPPFKPPFAMIWFMGSVHVTVNRHFVRFIFESEKAKWILNSLHNTAVPDEEFFPTLNNNPHLRIPGSYIGDPTEDMINQTHRLENYFITRFKNWGDWLCSSGYVVRKICILGVADLPLLGRLPHLFANKFFEGFQPATLLCLEEWYRMKVFNELSTGNVALDIEYYENLLFVKRQYRPND